MGDKSPESVCLSVCLSGFINLNQSYLLINLNQLRLTSHADSEVCQHSGIIMPALRTRIGLFLSVHGYDHVISQMVIAEPCFLISISVENFSGYQQHLVGHLALAKLGDYNAFGSVCPSVNTLPAKLH